MKDYMKPELEVITFTAESIADGIGGMGGGNTSNLIPEDGIE